MNISKNKESLIYDKVWKTISPLINRSKKRIVVISYVTNISLVNFKKDDILICDAAKHAISTGQTKAALLKILFDKGVKIYSFPYLHSKLIITDTHTIIGSANISIHSKQHLWESCIITRSTKIRSAAVKMAKMLCGKDNLLDNDKISRMLKIPVNRSGLWGERKNHFTDLLLKGQLKETIFRFITLNGDLSQSEVNNTTRNQGLACIDRENVLQETEWLDPKNLKKRKDEISRINKKYKTKRIIYIPIKTKENRIIESDNTNQEEIAVVKLREEELRYAERNGKVCICSGVEPMEKFTYDFTCSGKRKNKKFLDWIEGGLEHNKINWENYQKSPEGLYNWCTIDKLKGVLLNGVALS
jgi:hypothetical protein